MISPIILHYTSVHPMGIKRAILNEEVKRGLGFHQIRRQIELSEEISGTMKLITPSNVDMSGPFIEQ